jgi:DNA-binding NtrC family response regulator
MSGSKAGDATTAPFAGSKPLGGIQGGEAMALVIAWSSHEPERVGEVAILTEDAHELGRGDQAQKRLVFCRQRPGSLEPQAPLMGPGISRRQLTLRARGPALVIENIGRCPVCVNGERIDKSVAAPGDTLLIEGQLLLYVTSRPTALPPLQHFPADGIGRFGKPDTFGMIGESPEAWQLRDRLAFAARAPGHVLVAGASGTGKELVAHALHRLSKRADGSFVARNAATFPEGLIDAELFGNVKNYPNPGMAERRGLFGEAHGGTLFLDEIAELPLALQSHLLRVLDDNGEYQRLGESSARRADVRLVGATNREPASLRADLLARFALRVDVPPLALRREDVPLLLRHRLERAASEGAELVQRFAKDAGGTPRLDGAFVDHLLRRSWTTNVRELETLLWRALSTSTGDEVSLSDAELSAAQSEAHDEVAAPPAGARAATEISAAELRAAIARHQGNLAETARALGLSSRYGLYRLLKKHGIDVDKARGGGAEP